MSARLGKVMTETPAAKGARPTPSEAERQAWIEQAAYYRAEKRGFTPGSEIEDWIAAEAELMAHLGGRQAIV
jgi:hypothetical protein